MKKTLVIVSLICIVLQLHAQIPSNGLVGHWLFDGNVTNQIVGGMNGVATSISYTTDRLSVPNGSVLMDGDPSNVRLDNSNVDLAFIHNTHVFGVSFFVRIDNLTARNVLMASAGATVMKGFSILFENHASIGYKKIRFVTYRGISGQKNQLLSHTNSIADNDWHHVVISGDGSTVKMYIDGIQTSTLLSNPSNSTGYSNPDVHIGSTPIDNGGTLLSSIDLQGAMDDLRIYNRSLTPIEVVALSNEGYVPPSFTVSKTTATTSEAGTDDTFTVVLGTEPTSDVNFTVAENSTEGSVDKPTLIFTAANWSTPQTVTVQHADDPVVDGDQLYNITIAVTDGTSADEYDPLLDQIVAVTNQDNDVASFVLSKTAATTSEAGTNDTFTVVLGNVPTSDVNFTVAETSAEGNVDKPTLTFTNANWSTPQTVTVQHADDAVVDGDQSYDITIAVTDETSADEYDPLSDQIVTVTNQENEVASFGISKTSATTSEAGSSDTFIVVLGVEPAADVILNLTESSEEGSLSSGILTFTSATWSTPQVVTIQPSDDSVVDGDQTYDITISSDASSVAGYATLADQLVTVTNQDNDVAGFTISATSLTTNESGTTSSFTIALDSEPSGAVKIDLNENSDEGSVDQTTLTFNSTNWSSGFTVLVLPADDFVSDGDQQYPITISIDDAASDTEYGLVPDQTITVTNQNNDIAGFTVNETEVTTSEEGTEAVFTVVLQTEPAGVVKIKLTEISPEGNLDKTELTFTPADWATYQTVTVLPVDDNMVDEDITYDVIISVDDNNSSNEYDAVADYIVKVTNVNNDFFSQWSLANGVVYPREPGVKVAIGTQAVPSGYSLAVDGKAIMEEVGVQLSGNWPDYVFEPDYNLPALESIEKFIKSEKHLPEIPSAKEVEANGIVLGKMNTLLLKKVEELTLYTIDQSNSIQNLQSLNKELEIQLEANGLLLRALMNRIGKLETGLINE
ncbi:MAG: LamG-like jellyroll fold domain-containing protein [Cyclobacteriaceae bacterium]